MDLFGSYWLGLTDIKKNPSGLEWTDGSILDYLNFENQSETIGKCIMIKRLEDPNVIKTVHDNFGSVFRIDYILQEGNIITEFDSTTTFNTYYRDENTIYDNTNINGDKVEIQPDGSVPFTNGWGWTFSTNRVKWSAEDCST
jgi:hypothetical protein